MQPGLLTGAHNALRLFASARHDSLPRANFRLHSGAVCWTDVGLLVRYTLCAWHVLRAVVPVHATGPCATTESERGGNAVTICVLHLARRDAKVEHG